MEGNDLYFYLAILFLALAVLFLLPSVSFKKRTVRVSQMSDRQLRRFLRRSGLADREEAENLSVIRQSAQSFERTRMVTMLNVSEDFVLALETALAAYYGAEQ